MARFGSKPISKRSDDRSAEHREDVLDAHRDGRTPGQALVRRDDAGPPFSPGGEEHGVLLEPRWCGKRGCRRGVANGRGDTGGVYPNLDLRRPAIVTTLCRNERRRREMGVLRFVA